MMPISKPALNAALMACADLSLDPDVVALQRIVLQETGQFSDLAATFYTNGIDAHRAPRCRSGCGFRSSAG